MDNETTEAKARTGRSTQRKRQLDPRVAKYVHHILRRSCRTGWCRVSAPHPLCTHMIATCRRTDSQRFGQPLALPSSEVVLPSCACPCSMWPEPGKAVSCCCISCTHRIRVACRDAHIGFRLPSQSGTEVIHVHVPSSWGVLNV